MNDAGSIDAGAIDAGTNDAGTIDAGTIDAGSVDAGSLDAGTIDAGFGDAGFADGGTNDAGSLDAGSLDAGSLDGGSADGGSVDGGSVDGGAIVPDAGPFPTWSPRETVITDVLVAGARVEIGLPRTGIEPSEVGVVVNVRDPQSVAVAAHYLSTHQLSPTQRIEVSFDPSVPLTPSSVNALKNAIDADAGRFEALALTWTAPWQVNGMSITSALSFGFDAGFVSTGTCSQTSMSPFYGSWSTHPFSELGVRPAMLVAGEDAGLANAVISRSAAARSTFPSGRGSFFRTSDLVRSQPRRGNFESTVGFWNHDGGVEMQFIDSRASATDTLINQPDVLFYETGLVSVANLTTNTFVPGALADHLTSFGGILRGGSQMSVLRWLEAGASASYGTVREPCAYPQKFPAAPSLVAHYLRGSTALEAYASSVAWPGEGLFVGDPLAAPYRAKVTVVNGQVVLRLPAGRPLHRYRLFAGQSWQGPWRVEASWNSTGDRLETLTVAPSPVLLLVDEGEEAPFTLASRPGLVPLSMSGRRLATQAADGAYAVEELERTGPRVVASRRKRTSPVSAQLQGERLLLVRNSLAGTRALIVEDLETRVQFVDAAAGLTLPDGGADVVVSSSDVNAELVAWTDDHLGSPSGFIRPLDGGTVTPLGPAFELAITPTRAFVSGTWGADVVSLATQQRASIMRIPAGFNGARVLAARDVNGEGEATVSFLSTNEWTVETWLTNTSGAPRRLARGSVSGDVAALLTGGPVWAETIDDVDPALRMAGPNGIVRLSNKGLNAVVSEVSSPSGPQVFAAWSENRLGPDAVRPPVMITATAGQRAAFLFPCRDAWFAAAGEVAGCHVRTGPSAQLRPLGGLSLTAPGDVNDDGIADTTDATAMMNGLGSRRGEPSFDVRLDLDDDGEVTMADLVRRADDLAEGRPIGFARLTAGPVPNTLQTLRLEATRGAELARSTTAYRFEAAPVFIGPRTLNGTRGVESFVFLRVFDPDDEVFLEARPIGSSPAGLSFAIERFGDLNADGVMNSLDLAALRRRVGATVGTALYSARFDLDGDGDIDVSDATLMGSEGRDLVVVLRWLPPVGAPSSSMVLQVDGWDRRTPLVRTDVTLTLQ